jgi:hypothetical protein
MHPDGEDLPDAAHMSRRMRYALVVLAVVVLAAIVVGFVARHHPRHPTAQPSHRAAASSGASGASSLRAISSAPRTLPAPRRRSLGHPLLNGHGSYQLFIRTPDAVVRIDVRSGRVVHTPLGRLQSSGPVTFLAGPYGAIVRPIDSVPGYIVPAGGGPPHPLRGALARSAVYPGPKPGEVWQGATVVALDTATGHHHRLDVAARQALHLAVRN